mmetsp:Transcript_103277/g.301307  ORF Transcript_103277/g.301307 Transcript_103277/m.301307 type:complete len:209 (-) Transcript_103277:421-1047(-)
MGAGLGTPRQWRAWSHVKHPLWPVGACLQRRWHASTSAASLQGLLYHLFAHLRLLLLQSEGILHLQQPALDLRELAVHDEHAVATGGLVALDLRRLLHHRGGAAQAAQHRPGRGQLLALQAARALRGRRARARDLRGTRGRAGRRCAALLRGEAGLGDEVVHAAGGLVHPLLQPRGVPRRVQRRRPSPPGRAHGPQERGAELEGGQAR